MATASRPKKRPVVKPAIPAKTAAGAGVAAKATVVKAGKPAAKSTKAKAAALAASKAAFKAKAGAVSRGAVSRDTAPDLYSSLHALLHTMRLIERHDEPLCSMHDELKRTGKLSAAQRRRLERLVEELPAQEYQADLDALRQAITA